MKRTRSDKTEMHSTSIVSAALLVAALSLIWPSASLAQARLLIEAGTGFSAPAGQLAHRQEFGTTLGLNVGFRIRDGWTVKASTDLEMLEGTFVGIAERSAPMALTHLSIGAERRVVRFGNGEWEILGEFGAGRSTMRTVGLGSANVVDRPFDHSCNSSYWGLTTLTHPTRRATVFMRGRLRWMKTARDQTEELVGSVPFTSAFTLPITVGFVLSL